MLDSIPRSGLLVGFKQTSRAIKEKQVSLVYLAVDCDDHIKNQIRSLCHSEKIECVEQHTMESLGKACGIDVGASVVGLI